MKKHLIVYYGDATECVEKFGKDCKRSCKGALHVNPGRQITVTDDELECIKKHHKHILPKLRILSSMNETEKEAKAETKKEAKAEKEVKETQEEVEETQEEGKKKVAKKTTKKKSRKKSTKKSKKRNKR